MSEYYLPSDEEIARLLEKLRKQKGHGHNTRRRVANIVEALVTRVTREQMIKIIKVELERQFEDPNCRCTLGWYVDHGNEVAVDGNIDLEALADAINQRNSSE